MTANDRMSPHELRSALQAGWSQFLSRFNEMSPSERQAWLDAQGYPTLKDFLAHVIAWWEFRIERTTALVAGNADRPGAQRDLRVDDFNAQAVERFADWTEEDAVLLYRELLERFEKLLTNLSEDDLERPGVYDGLFASVVEHYESHALPDSPSLRRYARQ